MSEDNNLNKENDQSKEQGIELHSNQTPNETMKEKVTQVPKQYDSPYSVVKKALPLAFGMAAIGIIITVVMYLLLK